MSRGMDPDERLFAEELGARLRIARRRRRLTSAETAAYLDLSVNSYSMYEIGQRVMPAHKIRRAAILFGVTVSWLYGEQAGHPQRPYSGETGGSGPEIPPAPETGQNGDPVASAPVHFPDVA